MIRIKIDWSGSAPVTAYDGKKWYVISNVFKFGDSLVAHARGYRVDLFRDGTSEDIFDIMRRYYVVRCDVDHGDKPEWMDLVDREDEAFAK